jgi:hypothetical protein
MVVVEMVTRYEIVETRPDAMLSCFGLMLLFLATLVVQNGSMLLLPPSFFSPQILPDRTVISDVYFKAAFTHIRKYS